MRGNLWGVLVAAVGVGILLKAVDAARPSAPSAETDAVIGVLSQLNPIAGLLLLLVGIGAFVQITFARGFD